MKATIYTLEAVLSAVIILAGISLIYPFREQREIQITETSYSCLKNLDQKGLLKYYVSNNMEDELNNNLKSCLPAITNFTFEICTTPTCSSNSLPNDRTIHSSAYLVAGYNEFNPKLINLWVWLK